MTSLRPGDKLDHYLIENLVERSGMASIFRATDEQTGRRVAIKVPHPEMEADPIFFERFNREQEIGQKLDHPGVMKVFPNEHHSQHYMVMEWVEGRLLRGLLNEQGKFPADRAVKIALQVASAQFSQTVGTPDYISPVQVKGKRGDARSDVYALGVMLYEMLTGKVPFTGPNALVIMTDRLLNNPIPPREIEPAISPQLQEIIYRAMERDPNQRYPNAHELILDLEHQDKVGVAERPEVTDWRKRRTPWARRVVLYAMLALIPIVVFGLLLWVARH